MSILLVGVNYKSSDLVPSFLASVPTDADVTCVIVDNSECAREAERLRSFAAGRTDVRIVVAPENLGYLGALRYTVAQESAAGYQWTLLSNLDVRFERDFFQSLTEMSPNGVGLIGPDIFDVMTGRSLNPFMELRPKLAHLRRLQRIFRYPVVARVYVAGSAWVAALRPVLGPPTRIWGSRQGEGTERDVYAVHGAVLILSKSFFERGGDLEYSGFLFGEELALAEKCRRLELPARVVSRLRVRHDGHATTGIWRSSRTLKWQHDSLQAVVELMEDASTDTRA